MAESQPLSDEERTELIAYLDGELDAQASRAVEARLNLDPQTRHEAGTLRSAWAMLDYLPRAEPSTAFTSRTLERVSTYRPISTPAVSRPWRPLVFRAAGA